MDAGSDHGSAAKGSTIDLEVAGSGLVSYCFFIPLACLSMNMYVYPMNIMYVYSMNMYVRRLYIPSS